MDGFPGNQEALESAGTADSDSDDDMVVLEEPPKPKRPKKAQNGNAKKKSKSEGSLKFDFEDPSPSKSNEPNGEVTNLCKCDMESNIFKGEFECDYCNKYIAIFGYSSEKLPINTMSN
ncbi:unnamed protein product [Medioppia subpectinata]|uniref:Uncharacterized protein n=1 Tax=Medioppia subpectinata TaxID=1979941 RepID=A0A7R9KFQ6_9ACAR|nr:unnamed protein product [Medioppia subpectinata]CAG2102539.1 unnamed protein product [Medioppia subpectinata]